MLRGCAGGCGSRGLRRPPAAVSKGWPRMHGDRLAHSPACQQHLVTADCPVDCLAAVLPSRVAGRLARADGRRGELVASCGTPATVGDVARLFRQGRLGEIGGLGPGGVREVGPALVSCGLAAAGGEAITAECPVGCLRSVISGRVLNRLPCADGRGCRSRRAGRLPRSAT
jgi:hypothetical protein